MFRSGSALRKATMTAFELGEHQRPGWREVLVKGELDLAVAPQFKIALDRALAAGTDLLVDFERCEFLDSSGLALIVQARTTLEERGGRLFARAPSHQVLRLLAITGLLADGLVLEPVGEAGDRPPRMAELVI